MCIINIRREYTPHINPNDCWALVLARVSGNDYNDIYQKLQEKGYADNEGLNNMHVNDILSHYKYYPVDLSAFRQNLVISDILKAFYSKEAVIGSFNIEKRLMHLSYAYKGVDYTTSEVDSSMDDPVLYLWIKTQN